MTAGSTLLFRSREKLSGKSCLSCSGSKKKMTTAEEKWKQEQLLVAEKIGEDPAAGRENQNAKSKSTSRETKARTGLYTEHRPVKAHTSYWIQWQQK
jgi:hypothetical protein